MEVCSNCEAEVSDVYFRVFAYEGVLHGCLHCQYRHGDHRPDSDGEARSTHVGYTGVNEGR